MSHISSTSDSASVLRSLLRDRWVQSCAALVAALSIPYLFPVLSAEEMENYSYYLDLPLHLLTIAVLVIAARRAKSAAESRMWNLFAAGFGCWSVIRVGEMALPWPVWDHLLTHLTTKVLYVALYLFLALGLSQRPDRGAARHSDIARRVETAGATVLAFGLLIYTTVIIPGETVGSDQFFGSSLVVYLILDCYLIVRLIRLHREAGRQWRVVYQLLALTPLAWLGLDFFELMYTRIAPVAALASDDSPVWILWLLPSLGFVAAVRSRELSKALEEIPLHPIAATTPETFWPNRLLVFAFVFPALHFGFEIFGVLDPETRQAREICVLIVLIVVAWLNVVYDRRLVAESLRLESEHRRVSEQLELSQRMEAVRRLAGGIAHDFNNTLMVIRANAESVLDRLAADDSAKEEITQIAAAADRAASLTDQLLTVSQRREVRARAIALNPLVGRVETMLRRVVPENVELVTTLDPEAGGVLTDPAGLEDALVNLVMNARDAVSAGGRIEVRTGQVSRSRSTDDTGRELAAGVYGLVEVQDNGLGIDAETRPHVFEPFVSTKKEGTGLGLSTLYSFVVQSGGGVEIESGPTEGTRVRLLLPGTASLPIEPETPPEIPLSASSVETILLVEDEAAVRQVIRHLLLKAGYEVIEANNGREALALLEAQGGRFDVVLTDVVMPQMGGLALAKVIEERRPRLPVVFMTGYAGGESPSPEDGGVGSVLKKPFDGEQLKRAIRKATARPQRDGDAVAAAGAMTRTGS